MRRSRFLVKAAKFAVSSLASAGLLWGSAAQAVELENGFGVDLTLTAVSDYRDSGVSQTKGDPALQLDAMLYHETGLYVGIFSSNVDFGTKAYREDFYYAGINIPFTEHIYFNTYAGRYEYPKEAYADFNEFYAELGAYGFQLGYTYDFDARGHTPNSTNVFAGYNLSLPWESNFFVRYGYNDVRFDAFWSNSGESRQSFHDWEATLSREFFGVKVFASYIDTDLSKAECYSATGFDDVCSATVLVGASKTF